MSRRRTAATESGSWGDEPLRLSPAALARRLATLSTTRPQPSPDVADDVPERFVPDAAFAGWIRDTFVSATGALADAEHEHLLDAKIGVLWTNSVNVSKMRHVLATAEIPQTMGGAWKRGRAEQQLRDWFECEPDFLLTFYAPECALLDDRAFCALVKHELCHCAQAEDQFGSPRFDRFGAPIYAIRGHDVEEFTSVVRLFGPTPAVREMIAAARTAPTISDATIAAACGTCMRRAA